MNKENFNQLKDSLYAHGFEILINNVELENCYEEEPAHSVFPPVNILMNGRIQMQSCTLEGPHN